MKANKKGPSKQQTSFEERQKIKFSFESGEFILIPSRVQPQTQVNEYGWVGSDKRLGGQERMRLPWERASLQPNNIEILLSILLAALSCLAHKVITQLSGQM